MRQLEQLNLDIQNPETIENKMYNLLLNMKYTDETAKKIIMKIQDYTNQDYNFDMYRDYRDEVEEKIIAEFINEYTMYKPDKKFDTLEEAKQELRQYLDEKYCMYENDWIYCDELAKELDIIDDVDWWEVVEAIRDELGLLYVDYDMLDICKWRYRIAIYPKKSHDLFTTCFFDWKYKDEERLEDWKRVIRPTYWKQDIEDTKDQYLLQKLCKANDFDIEDIYKYQMSEDWSREEQKYTEFREKNKFFDELYIELCNTFWYAEDLRFLTNMDIDDLLLYTCVKNQKYNLRWCSFWFYDHVNWSGSMFDWDIGFNYEVNTDDIDVMLFSNVHYFEETYWFTNKPFWL